MNTLLLTGGSGFLGSRIAERLKDRFDITLLQRSNPGTSQQEFSSVQCDLADGEIPSDAITSWDVVVHAAGRAHIFNKHETEKQFHRVNVTGTWNLLNGLKKEPPKLFVYISSVSVYGLTEGYEIDENQPLYAEDPYGISKMNAEYEVLNWAGQTGVDTVILRPPLIVGPNPPGNLGRMIKTIKSGRYLGIGKGKARKSVVWADDIADLIPGLTGKNGVYNVSDGYHPTFFELENAIASQFNSTVWRIPGKVALALAYLGMILNKSQTIIRFPLDIDTYHKITKTLTFSSEKAKKELGWNPNEVLRNFKWMKAEK
jgi:GlcNAc-P-P-Und epimerase